MVKKYRKKKKTVYEARLMSFETWFGSITLPVVYNRLQKRIVRIKTDQVDPKILRLLPKLGIEV